MNRTQPDKGVPSLPGLPRQLRRYSLGYASVSGTPVMLVGSTASAVWKVPVRPRDIDIVVSRDHSELPGSMRQLVTERVVSVHYIEDGLPFLGHSNRSLDLRLCRDHAVVVRDTEGVFAVPTLEILFVLGVKKVDDAFSLAKASYEDQVDANAARELLYRSLSQLESISMAVSEAGLAGIAETLADLQMGWFLQPLLRTFSILGRFVELRGASSDWNKKVSGLRAAIQNAVAPSYSPAAELAEDLTTVVTHQGAGHRATMVTGPSGILLSFRETSGNVYRFSRRVAIPKLQDDRVRHVTACSDVRIVHLQITDACPLSCPHCHFSKGDSFLTQEKAGQLLASFAEAGILEVDLGEGGEPLCHPELRDLIQMVCNDHGMVANLSSNLAVPLSDSLLRVVTEGVGSVAVSIDRLHYGDFAKIGLPRVVSSNLSRLLEAGVRVSANYVYGNRDLNRLSRDLSCLAGYGLGKVTFLRRFPMTDLEEILSPELIVALLECAQARDVDLGFAACDPILDSPVLRQACARQGYLIGPTCLGGRDFVYVNLEGRVAPCGHYPPSMLIGHSSFKELLVSGLLTGTVSRFCNMSHCARLISNVSKGSED